MTATVNPGGSPARNEAALTGGGNGVIALPAAASALDYPVAGVLVHTAGNMGLIFADGTSSESHLVAVTAGMYFPFRAVAVSASNTAGLWGVN